MSEHEQDNHVCRWIVLKKKKETSTMNLKLIKSNLGLKGGLHFVSSRNHVFGFGYASQVVAHW
jgi:hypothetical protein